jgi:hypothetical protein
MSCRSFISAALLAACAWSHAQGLPELEQLARSGSAQVRLAQEEAALRQHRLEAAEAQRGGRFFGGASLHDTREPVTDNVVRDYRRGSAVVGARWPLLEGAEAQERVRTEARGAADMARIRQQQTEDEAVLQMRLAYIDHLRSGERLKLAEGLLQLEPAAAPRLAARTGQLLLLEADRQALQSIFETARRDAARQRALRDEALARMRRLSGSPLATVPDTPPGWNLSCVASPATVLGGARSHAEAASVELSVREALRDQQRWNGIDAGVSLTQSVSRDIGASSGRSTGVSVDLSIPFGWRELRDARRAEAQSAVRRARLELDAAREAEAAAREQAIADWRVREADVRAYVQRLDAAWEALRVAELRAKRLEGDVLEKLVQTRHGLYVAGVEMSDALQRLQRAQAQLLAFVAPCEGTAPALAPASLALIPAALAASPGQKTESALRLSWFAWDAAPWLAEPTAQLNRLPAQSERVLLGLNAAQLRALSDTEARARLQTLLQQAHARGIRVELLLGDPEWVLPAGREALLALLKPIATLPLDGLNLDLERSQLPQAQQAAWHAGLIDTLQAVQRAVPWRLALTTHDRDLQDSSFNRRLAAVGVDELVPMIYVTDKARTVQRTRAVLDAAAGLPVLLTQSIETALPAGSSLHRLGREGALSALRDIASQLAATPGFAGIAVQSFEDYLNTPP